MGKVNYVYGGMSVELSRQIEVCELLDYYENLLTDVQRETMRSYYSYDNSLNEIAIEQGVTKQGVKANLSAALRKLDLYECNLHLVQKMKKYHELRNEISDLELLKKLDEIFEE